MKKQLHRTVYIREIKLKDGTLIKYKNYNSYLCYKEVNENIKEITDWNELLRELDYIDCFKGETNRKGRVWCELDYSDKHGYRCQTKLYQDEFLAAKVYYENNIINYENIRMKTLVDELSVEDFIAFVKDNEISGIGGYKIMTFSEIEQFCEHIIQDNTINKKDCDSKNSQMYQIYNGLCKTEGRMTGSLFAKVMKDKHKISILID